MKRTYQLNNRKRKKVHRFLIRMALKAGRNVLQSLWFNRRKKLTL